MWPFGKKPNRQTSSGRPSSRTTSREWELIGTNRNPQGIPPWVLSAFGSMPGSHGTMLIDYPEPGMSIYLNGKTFRYRIDMGDQSWRVHRRRRSGRK